MSLFLSKPSPFLRTTTLLQAMCITANSYLLLHSPSMRLSCHEATYLALLWGINQAKQNNSIDGILAIADEWKVDVLYSYTLYRLVLDPVLQDSHLKIDFRLIGCQPCCTDEKSGLCSILWGCPWKYLADEWFMLSYCGKSLLLGSAFSPNVLHFSWTFLGWNHGVFIWEWCKIREILHTTE